MGSIHSRNAYNRFMGGERRSRVSFSRRELLKRIAGTTACLPFATTSPLLLAALPQEQLRPPNSPNSFVGPKLFSDSDDALLQELEAASFWYFWEQANPDTDSSGTDATSGPSIKAIWEASHPPVLD
jgi:hypothetical protein